MKLEFADYKNDGTPYCTPFGNGYLAQSANQMYWFVIFSKNYPLNKYIYLYCWLKVCSNFMPPHAATLKYALVPGTFSSKRKAVQ